jgi:hypothetical protein
MEMIMNEYDMIVGATFEEGTIQDYVDEENTYGLIRLKDSTANWFLYNKEDSPSELKELYANITQKSDHFIQDDHGEEIVIFNKQGKEEFEKLAHLIDEYLDAEMGNIL